MPSYRARALVLKRTKLGETDLIITLLGADGCQLRGVAKGARKPGSRFGARVEPFSVGDFMFATGRTLDVITDVETVTSNAAIRSDYDRAQAAAVVADVLDKISVECQTEERLFGLAAATFDAMLAADIDDLLALVVAFLAKAMAMNGYRPRFEACASCGRRVAAGDRGFSLEAGGPLCAGCETRVRDLTRVDVSVLGALGVVMRSTMAEVGAHDIPRAVLLECFALMRAFVGYHLPARLKALDLYTAGIMAERR